MSTAPWPSPAPWLFGVYSYSPTLNISISVIFTVRMSSWDVSNKECVRQRCHVRMACSGAICQLAPPTVITTSVPRRGASSNWSLITNLRCGVEYQLGRLACNLSTERPVTLVVSKFTNCHTVAVDRRQWVLHWPLLKCGTHTSMACLVIDRTFVRGSESEATQRTFIVLPWRLSVCISETITYYLEYSHADNDVTFWEKVFSGDTKRINVYRIGLLKILRGIIITFSTQRSF